MYILFFALYESAFDIYIITHKLVINVARCARRNYGMISSFQLCDSSSVLDCEKKKKKYFLFSSAINLHRLSSLKRIPIAEVRPFIDPRSIVADGTTNRRRGEGG